MVTSLSDRAGFLIVANLVKYAVGFVMPMVLVRLLSQSDYGSYQQMILIGTAAIGVLTLGLPTSIYYLYHHVGNRKIPALLVQTTLMLAASGLLATVVIFLASDQFSSMLNNPSMSGLLQIYALSLVFMIGSEHCLHFMIAQNQYGRAVVFEVAETFIRVLTLLIPLWLGYGFTGLIIGIVIYSAMRFIVRNAYLFRKWTGNMVDAFQNTSVREQLAYSIPVALVSLAGLIGSTLNRGMLAATVTPAFYAIYAVGALEIPLDVIFQSSVANVLRASLPPLVRDGNLDEVVRVMREAVRKLSTIVLPSFIFLLGHSHQFIVLLFTTKYAESVTVFQIYLWLVPLHMLVLSPIPQVFGKPKLNFYIVLATTSLLLVLGYVLLKTVGFYGPALAMVITQYIQVGVFFVVVLRLTKSTMARLLPWNHMLRVVAAAGLSLVVSNQFDYLTASGLLNLCLSGVIFSLAFFAAGWFMGVFSPDDIHLLKRWVTRIFRIKFA